MELTEAIKAIGTYGWQSILSAAALIFALALVKPAESRKRPLLALAIAKVYDDACAAIGIWWKYRKETFEARRDRDRGILAAYSTAVPGGRRTVDRLLPVAPPGGGGAGDPGVNGQTIPASHDGGQDRRFSAAPNADRDPVPSLPTPSA